MNKKIDIIIPAYNVETLLEKCLDSVLNQTFKDFEVILINDGSTDNTGKICDEWAKKDKRIRLIHQENKGLSATRNIGLSLSTAPYIGFVDSDDWASRDMFEKMYKAIIKYNADISVCGLFKEYPHRGRSLKDGCLPKVMSKKTALYQLLRDRRLHSYCWNKLVKKELFENIIYPEGIMEDYRVAPFIFEKATRIAHTRTYSYHYIWRKSSILNSRLIYKEKMCFEAFYERYNYVLENKLLDKYQKKQIIWKLKSKMLSKFKEMYIKYPEEFANVRNEYQNVLTEILGIDNFSKASLEMYKIGVFFRRLFVKLGI